MHINKKYAVWFVMVVLITGTGKINAQCDLPVIKQDGWEWVYPKPFGGELKEYIFIPPSKLFACYEDGIILHSDETAQTWEQCQMPFNIQDTSINYFKEIIFYNGSETGYALSSLGNFLITKDGGKTWNYDYSLGNLNLGDPENLVIEDIALKNDTLAILLKKASYTYALIKHRDWQSWENDFFVNNTNIIKIDYPFVWSYNELYEKASKRFNNIDISPDGMVRNYNGDIYHIGKGENIQDGNIYKNNVQMGNRGYYFYLHNNYFYYLTHQNNGYEIIGSAFHRKNVITEENENLGSNSIKQCTEFKFIDSNNGYFEGYYKDESNIVRFLRFNTNISGNFWTKETLPYYYEADGICFEEIHNVQGVYFVNNQKGYLMTNTEVYKTIDGGKNWTELYNDHSFSCLDTTINFYVSEIYDDYYYLQDDHKLYNKDGWIASGIIDFSPINNGSEIWTLNNLGKIELLNSGNVTTVDSKLKTICFLSSNFGYAAGEQGKIYKTTNGISYTDVSVMGVEVNSLSFLNENEGFVACNDGTLFKTLNAGVNWEPVLTRISEDIHYVKFFDEQTGFFLTNSSLYYTTDGGANFSKVHPPFNWNEFGAYKKTPGLTTRYDNMKEFVYAYGINVLVTTPFEPSLFVNKSILNLEDIKNSSASLEITANTQWQVSANKDWVDMSADSGIGSSTISVTAIFDNPYEHDRSCQITITAESLDPIVVDVIQKGRTYIIAEDSVTLNKYANSSANVELEANVQWYANPSQEWISVSPAEGMQGAYLIITALTENGPTARTGEICITDSSSISDTIKVTQKGNSLEIVNTELSFPPHDNVIKQFTIRSNCDWVVTTNDTWMEISNTTGSNNATINVEMMSNNSTNMQRTGTVTVSAAGVPDQSVEIIQEAPEIYADTSELEIKAGESSCAPLKVFCNTHWEIKTNNSWIHTSALSLLGDKTTNICVEKNAGSRRTGSVTVTTACGTCTAQISVVQQAPFIHFDEPSLTIEAAENAYKGFYVRSNTDWHLTTDVSWLSLMGSKRGKYDRYMHVYASQNDMLHARSGNVVLHSEGIDSVVLNVVQEIPSIDIDVSSLTLKAANNAVSTFNIQSNTDWKITTDVNWLTVSLDSGNYERQITVNAASNNQEIPRTSNITITADGLDPLVIHVEQEAPFLGTDKSILLLKAAEGVTGSFNIESNSDWKIISDVDWLTCDHDSGTYNQQVLVYATRNHELFSRTGNITITVDGLEPASVQVEQEVPEIQVSENALNVGYQAGDTKNITVSSNTDWKIINNSSWISTNVNESTYNGSITVSILENNPKPSMRTDTISVKAIGTGLEEIIIITQDEGLINHITSKDDYLHVYPNPTKDKIMLEMQSLQIGHVRIFNMSGINIMEMPISVKKQTIDVSDLPSGIYLIQLHIEGKVITTRFVKQK